MTIQEALIYIVGPIIGTVVGWGLGIAILLWWFKRNKS